ncbi:LacI family DNA-binding transcriptional regulator [Dactylosporangium sp. NPDC049742]|uniref:LacI family DNA-binding transcriptional regulator n=1 Tax=Dactylosporangium sp. NPDC049742 TaxID=3154737 RepID=UPI0034404F55
MARVTLQTIADQVGVSRMTVSNAFSRPDQLSPTLRDKILAVASDLGYVGPDPAARALARGTTGAVGVLLTESLRYAFNDEVATTFLGAISEELAPTGLALTLLTAAAREDVVPARDVAMDGAMVYSCDPASTAVDWLIRRRIPLVFIDQVPTGGIPCVNVADRPGARAAAQHLVDLGHRRVAVVTSGVRGAHGLLPTGSVIPGAAVDEEAAVVDGYVAQQRILGWLDALTPAGITPPVVRLAHGQPEDGYDGAKVLLAQDPRPTAILCFSDAIAQGVVQAAHDLGLRVPEDLSVVGFDDSPLAARMRPGLTTVRQDVLAKGRAAAAALTRAIAETRAGTEPTAEQILVPADLIVRESTAPPS